MDLEYGRLRGGVADQVLGSWTAGFAVRQFSMLNRNALPICRICVFPWCRNSTSCGSQLHEHHFHRQNRTAQITSSNSEGILIGFAFLKLPLKNFVDEEDDINVYRLWRLRPDPPRPTWLTIIGSQDKCDARAHELIF